MRELTRGSNVCISLLVNDLRGWLLATLDDKARLDIVARRRAFQQTTQKQITRLCEHNGWPCLRPLFHECCNDRIHWRVARWSQEEAGDSWANIIINNNNNNNNNDEEMIDINVET